VANRLSGAAAGFFAGLLLDWAALRLASRFDSASQAAAGCMEWSHCGAPWPDAAFLILALAIPPIALAVASQLTGRRRWLWALAITTAALLAQRPYQ
jgi:hypothetical protein